MEYKVLPENDDDEECEAGVRVLSDAEYSRVLGRRGDIFRMEKDSRLSILVAACLAIGLGAGVYMSTTQIVKYMPEFLGNIPQERTIRFVQATMAGILGPQKPQERRTNQNEPQTDTRTLNPKPNKPGSGGTNGGGGDPRSRVTQKGILGLISDKITGKPVLNADIFGKGGFAKGIDGILLGMSALKSGGSGGSGRKGQEGIGFGIGEGPGFGGGNAGDINDAINGLFSNEGGNSLTLLKRGGTLQISEPTRGVTTGGGAITGGRSRASIMRVVMQNISALRYAYNKRLREKPGLKGKITCKFAIDEFGKVIFCELLESSMSDPELEAEVKDKINRWVFDKIDKPGDVTEVQYPFVFAQ